MTGNPRVLTEAACPNCRFCEPVKRPGFSWLECHRHSPVVFPDKRPEGVMPPQARWPRASGLDWCGDHRPKEEENDA